MEGKYRTSFTDEELIAALRASPDEEQRRNGNLWTFFYNLPTPERTRLEQLARPRVDGEAAER